MIKYTFSIKSNRKEVEYRNEKATADKNGIVLPKVNLKKNYPLAFNTNQTLMTLCYSGGNVKRGNTQLFACILTWTTKQILFYERDLKMNINNKIR